MFRAKTGSYLYRQLFMRLPSHWLPWCNPVLERKRRHETLSPMFPVQAPLSHPRFQAGGKWATRSMKLHQLRCSSSAWWSRRFSVALQYLSRALSFNGRKPGDERPNALMFLQHKLQPLDTQLAAYPICCKHRLVHVPIMESIANCFIGGGGRHQCFQKQIPAAWP